MIENIVITIILLGVVLTIVLGINVAYRNGVRDGYANPWISHVKKQIEDEHLRQYKEWK